jgi:hypothetical protein
MEKLNLEQFDVDGAIQLTAAEAHAALGGDTRLGFLRKAGIAGSAFAGGGGAGCAGAECVGRRSLG